MLDLTRREKSLPRAKLIHWASKIREDGAVSALCFAKARPMGLTKATWTQEEHLVTCPKCKRILAPDPRVKP